MNAQNVIRLMPGLVANSVFPTYCHGQLVERVLIEARF